jgi:hypothetical protein
MSALACVSCSLHKSAKQIVEDPVTGTQINIFNPRQQMWKEHFCWDGVRVVGLTVTGRGTIDAGANRSIILSIRGKEELLGCHPPP